MYYKTTSALLRTAFWHTRIVGFTVLLQAQKHPRKILTHIWDVAIGGVWKEQLLRFNASRRINVQLLARLFPLFQCRTYIFIYSTQSSEIVVQFTIPRSTASNKRYISKCTYSPISSPLLYASLQMWPCSCFRLVVFLSWSICHSTFLMTAFLMSSASESLAGILTASFTPSVISFSTFATTEKFIMSVI